jgi:hypothetical protein
MPISNEDFDRNLNDVSSKVLSFLKQNKDLGAFSLAEIADGIGFKGNTGETPVTLDALTRRNRRSDSSRNPGTGIPGYTSLKDMLNGLVSKGLVEMKTVNGKDYYRAR